jgi:hypothetical protein
MLSQMQYNQALQDAARMGMSAAASARGVNPALAFRSAQMATQEAQANAAQQAGQRNLIGALSGMGQAALSGGKK